MYYAMYILFKKISRAIKFEKRNEVKFLGNYDFFNMSNYFIASLIF